MGKKRRAQVGDGSGPAEAAQAGNVPLGEVPDEAAQDGQPTRPATMEVVHLLERPRLDLREAFPEEAVEAYREIPAEERPHVLVSYCPGDPEGHELIIDGMMMCLAAQEADEETIAVRHVEVSSRAEAYRKAVEANSKHGRHLTRTEKVRAAEQLAADGLNQEEIASIMHVNQSTVSRWLQEVLSAQAEEAGADMQSHTRPRTPPEEDHGPLSKEAVIRRLSEISEKIRRKRGPWINSLVTQLNLLIQEVQPPAQDGPDQDANELDDPGEALEEVPVAS